MSEDRTIVATGSGLTIPSGTRLNGIFEIERQVGSGGMGMVYRARNIETGDAVAVKIVRTEMADNPQVLALFRKEAAVLNKVSHDAIVRYYLFTTDPGINRPYLATEFVDGIPLTDVIEKGPLPRADLLALADRLADGLRAAHRHEIIHRDISPDNIILPDGDVRHAKIIDFGIARATLLGGGTVIGDSIAGKFDYMSPEQLGLYNKAVDARSDIYTLGIVLAEALLGRSLEMGGTQLEVIEKRRRVPDFSGIDPKLRALLTAMTQPKPDDRLQTMDAVAARVRMLMQAPEPAKAGPSGKVRFAAAIVGLVAIGAAAGGGYLLLTPEPEPADATPATLVANSEPSLAAPTESRASEELTAPPKLTPSTEATARPAPPLVTTTDTPPPLTPTDGTVVPPDDGTARPTPTETRPEQTSTPSAPDSPAGDGAPASDRAAATDATTPVEEAATPTGEIAATETGTDTTDQPPAITTTPEVTTGTDATPAGVPDTAATESDETPSGGGEGTATPSSTSDVAASDQDGAGAAEDTAGPPAEAADAEPTVAADRQEDVTAQKPQIAAVEERGPPVIEPEGPSGTQEETDPAAAVPDATDGGAATDAVQEPGLAPGGTDEPGGTATGPATNDEDLIAIDPESPLNPAGRPADGVLRYIRQYDAGPCTLLRTVTAGRDHAVVAAYGTSLDQFRGFDADFSKSTGFEANVSISLVNPAQCPVLDFLSRLGTRDDGTLRLQLDSAQVPSGGVLSGALTGLERRDLSVFVVGADGRLYGMNDLISRGADEATLHTVINGGAGPAQPHLMVAIAGEDVPYLTSSRAEPADQALGRLRDELARMGPTETAVAYFMFGG